MEELVTPAYVPLWFDLLAVFIGGLSGALIATRNRLDPGGVVVITIVSALGGGIIRDVLIQRGPPAALENPDYLYTALGAAAAGLIFRQLVRHVDRWFIIMDAAALGVYTLVGMEKGFSAHLPVITAAMLGVITATGGGLLRDLLSGEVPSLLRPGHLTLTASIAGAVLYALLDLAGLSRYVSFWIVIAAVMALRLASEYFGWSTPAADEVPDRMTDAAAKVLASRRRVRMPAMRSPTRRPLQTRRIRRQPDSVGDPGDEAGDPPPKVGA